MARIAHVAVAALMGAALIAGAARAAPLPPAAAQPTGTLTLEAGSGRVLDLPGAAASVFAADPKVAEVRPASQTSLFVFGRTPGRTTVAAMDVAGHVLAQYTLTVRPSRYAADAAAAAIARAVPGSHVAVSARPDGIVLHGTVGSAAAADRAVAAARHYVAKGGAVENRLHVARSVQVALRVRIAEMSRNVARALGVNWQALGSIGRFAVNFATGNSLGVAGAAASVLGGGYRGAVNVDAIIQALAQDNLAHLLAEPTLTAMSGQTASFLVGGEFPIPVGQQNGQVTIQFQQYGVSLSFVPTVLSGRRISLRVRPEVSELTTQGAVQLTAGNSAISVPALLVRRAETTVELGSGQSFAIAGLLQDNATLASTALPGLGQLPILGALFRSSSFQHDETELVIVITPYIVRPVSDPAALRLPTDGWRPPSDLERILLLRQTGRKSGSPVPHIPGDAGFLVQ